MRLPRTTFRLKLLTALLGSVALLVGVGLAVVGRETDRQVDLFVDASVARTRSAFDELVRIRREQLEQVGRRFTSSNRFPALLSAMLLDPDTAFFRLETAYELGLADLDSALVAFAGLDGAPVAAVEGLHAMDDAAPAVPLALLDGMVARGDTVGFGFHVVDGRVYGVHATLMRVVEEPIGFLALGTAIDDRAAASLGQALGGEVCFVAGSACVAGTLGPEDPITADALVAASRTGGRSEVEGPDGSAWTLVADSLPPAGDAWRVLAIPLDAILAPFERIRGAIRLAAVAALFFAALFATVISRGLARPVRALVAATGRVAAGDYAARVNVRSRDELGDLAASFNEMAEGLMLKEQYRGVLDKVVSPDVAAEMLKGDIVLGGENREVTTVFADIRGFSTITEGMEPQAVIGMLNEIMEHASAAVEAEGGVVDKYVGDEVMAIFGAPIARPDDPARALRAALRIRAAVAEISRRREARGEAGIDVGIGVNTGVAVAGNMGSERRLNYTVLGEAVNVAARLCSAAAPGEILASAATCERVSGIRTRPMPQRTLKGLSRVVHVFAVDGTQASAGTTAGVRGIAVATLVLALLGAVPATAQLPPPPEVRVRSPDGMFEAAVSGTLEVQAYMARAAPAGLLAERDPFLAPRVRLFVDLFAGDRVYALVEPRLDRGETPGARPFELRIDQAFIRATPIRGVPLTLQIGKFATPFGGYAARHLGPGDPLLRPPLAYDHRTMVAAALPPAANDAFIEWKNDPARFRPFGAPAVWQVPYPTGALATGALGRWELHGAVVNSAPSSAPPEWNPGRRGAPGPSWIAHVGFAPAAAWNFGVSWNRGPYMAPQAAVPAGYAGAYFDAGDYDQEIVALQARWSRGWIELRAEALMDRWEVPNVVDDPTEIGWYGEVKAKVAPGAWVASRIGGMHFLPVHRSDGTTAAWDYDVYRVQVGGGMRLAQALELRGEALLDRGEGLPGDVGGELFALQLAWLR
ncbi:MAG: adenylate/guanylate cyclase domain-containing protein [Gemmatimonadota bacterium]